jgi:signal transduction histidine kinase
VSVAASVGGWVAAAIVAAIVIGGRRVLDARMEAVARACHELRGPITAARLGLSCESRSATPSPARLRAIDAELGRATLALEDLADLRGRVPRISRLELVDLQALLAESVEAWSPSAAAAGATLEWSWSGAATLVWGDRLRLVQAVANLIANAVEHGAGPVQVVGTARERWVWVEVSDAGPGLPASLAVLSRGARRGRGAHGRGLAIASAVAGSHGGRLAAAPSARGARMVLELPLAGDQMERAG